MSNQSGAHLVTSETKPRLRLDLAANVSVIVTCSIISAMLGTAYVRQWLARATPASFVAIGDQLSIPVDFSAAGRTLFLVFRSDCRFCSDSMPFYRDLANRIAAQAKGTVRFIGLTPDNPEIAAAYLASNGLQLSETKTVDSSGIRVRGTPTLLLTDQGGRVLRIWRGLIPEAFQAQVLEAVGPSGGNTAGVRGSR